jgi:hypothetical protein
VIILGLLPPEKGAKKEAPNLNASARYSGTQIIITNSDSFNWDNLKIELNSGLLDSGYYYEGGTIKAGSTATIGLLNFAKSSGERLNPLLIKVRTAYISADTPSGRASYACQWN